MKPNTHFPERDCKHMLGVKTVSFGYLTLTFLYSLTISIIISIKGQTYVNSACSLLFFNFKTTAGLNALSILLKLKLEVEIASSGNLLPRK